GTSASSRGWNSRAFCRIPCTGTLSNQRFSSLQSIVFRLMIVGRVMKSEWESQWESMTIDELFELRELMQNILSEKLTTKKAELERRLQTLNPSSRDVGPTT